MAHKIVYQTQLLNGYQMPTKTFGKAAVKAIKEITPNAATYKTVTEFGQTTILIFDSSRNIIGHVQPEFKNGLSVGSIYMVKK